MVGRAWFALIGLIVIASSVGAQRGTNINIIWRITELDNDTLQVRIYSKTFHDENRGSFIALGISETPSTFETAFVACIKSANQSSTVETFFSDDSGGAEPVMFGVTEGRSDGYNCYFDMPRVIIVDNSTMIDTNDNDFSVIVSRGELGSGGDLIGLVDNAVVAHSTSFIHHRAQLRLR